MTWTLDQTTWNPIVFVDHYWPQLVGKFFTTLCSFLRLNTLTTTDSQPEANVLVEWYNQTIVAILWNYAAEHQHDWNQYMQLFTYIYNAQTNCATRLSPFTIILLQEPPSAVSFNILTCVLTDKSANTLACHLKRELVHLFATINKMGNRQLAAEQKW